MRTPYPNELMHYGILGMKWGVRRYQNPDGTYTAAGRERYGVGVANAKLNVKNAKANYIAQRKKYARESNYGLIKPSEKTSNSLVLARDEVKWAKQDYKAQKIKKRLDEETKSKSKHRLKLEESYRKKGLSPEDAEIAAYKRAKTEKILAITLGVTAAAAATYVAYKNYDKFFDINLRSGTILQSVSKNSNRGVRDAFYATYKKSDKDIYRGFFAKQHLKMRNGADNAFAYNGVLQKGLKVASERNSRKILSDLVKSDPLFAAKLLESVQTSKILYGEPKKALKSVNTLVKDRKVDQLLWEAFNQRLVSRTPLQQELNTRFYDSMRKAGYGAILDVNDRKYSGYDAKRPLIVFDTVSNNIRTFVEKLSDTEIDRKYDAFIKNDARKQKAKDIATGLFGDSKYMLPYAAVAGLTIGATTAYKSHQEKEAVSKYREEHPNSEMSDRDILRMLYQE